MRVLIIGVLLLLCVPAWGGESKEEKLEGLKTIYQDVSISDGTVYAVKTTNKKNTYFWYLAGQRCLAVASINPSKVSVVCPTERFTAVLDAGDVMMQGDNGLEVVAPEGTLMQGMFFETIARTRASKK